MTECTLCGAQLEKVGENLICKSCGAGFRSEGKPLPSMEKILQDGVFQIGVLKSLFPKATKKQLASLFSFHEHRVKKHPTTRDGFCEFCQVDWSKLSEAEFFEQLGYKKSYWFNEDGSEKPTGFDRFKESKN